MREIIEGIIFVFLEIGVPILFIWGIKRKKRKENEEKYKKFKENPQIIANYYYGIDSLVETEIVNIMLKESLTIVNETSKTIVLDYSKIANVKIIDNEELKNSAFAINLGIVQAIAANKTNKQYLIILYKDEEQIKK